MRQKIILPILLLVFSGCALSQQAIIEKGGKHLDGVALRLFLQDSTLQIEEHTTRATMTLHSNGTLLAKNDADQGSPGKWRISNDQLCFQFKRWNFGDEKCYTVLAHDNRYLLFSGEHIYAGNFTILTAGHPSVPQVSAPTPAAATNPTNAMQPVPQPAPPHAIPPSRHGVLDNQHIMTNLAHDCPGCNLANSSFRYANLDGANLQGANLSGADLRNTSLQGANLNGANLFKADLVLLQSESENSVA